MGNFLYELPFIVIHPVGSDETATIDTRYLNLMKVSDAFVQAQTPPKQPQQPQDMASLASLVNALRGPRQG